MSANRF